MRLRLGGLIALLLLVLASVPLPAEAQGERRWLADPELLTRRKVIGPDAGPLNQVADQIRAMDLIDSGSGWAVSYSGLLRFDDRFWSPHLDLGPRVSLLAIDMADARSGWAVGTAFAGGGPTVIYATRYNGRDWHETSTVVGRNGEAGIQHGTLVEVAAHPDGTAWAIGTAYDGGGMRPLVLHFDGTAWRDRTPDSWRHGDLLSLSMVSPTEGWVSGIVGLPNGEGSDAIRPVIAHLKDGVWTEQALPGVERPWLTSAFSVVMRDASEGWAILSEQVARCSTTRLLRYTSGQWIDATPANQPLQTIFRLALIPGTNRGWASLAGCAGPAEQAQTMRMRFDNGALIPDNSGSTLVPHVYALLSDDVQWAASRGAIMRYSSERLPTARVEDPGGVRYFETTGHILSGPFRRYYESYGLDLGDPGISDRESLALFGYPVSEPFDEINPDTGAVLRVQYFERARFEYHPTNPDPYNVLLGRLSANTLIRLDRTPGFEPAPPAPGPDCDRFSETMYALCPPFREFWRRSGGLPVFGFPLTAEAQELSQTDGKTYLTQWFERERLEYHPENRGTPYEILLGLLGSEELRVRGYLP